MSTGGRAQKDPGAGPLRDTLSQLRLRELLIEVQERVEEIVEGRDRLDGRGRLLSAFDDARRGMEGLESTGTFDAYQQQALAVLTSPAAHQAFDVDREDDDTTVVLIEGRVAVRALRRGSASPERLMVPGDRLRFRRDELTGADRPDMTVMSAWQTGRLIFAGETLLAAAREFNRYNKRHLVVADSALAAMQVSGVYDVDNPEGFARSIGFLLPIAARIDGDTITLSRIE